MSRNHQARGWNGPKVTALRARWALVIAQAEAHREPLACPICTEPLLPGMPFDLDHAVPLDDGGPLSGATPAHRACNRAGGAAITNAKRQARRMRTRPWL